MIDKEGYRLNVGIIVVNKIGQALWARRRYMHDAWQFPQGGIQEGEEPVDAMYRELEEELGLQHHQVKILAQSQHWFSYLLPKLYIRTHQKPLCIGQKQKWFLLELIDRDHCVNLSLGNKPEFDAWRWVDYLYPLDHVVDFKKEVYRQALDEFSGVVNHLVKDTQ